MQTAQETAGPVAALRAMAARPFEDAVAMPPEVYTSEPFRQRELERVFRRDWVCVGRASALSKPGDYLTYDLAGQPVMVIRDQGDGLRAFSNVCLHRMSTLLTGRGNTRAIVCPYHAWSYNLDGTLRGAPLMKATSGFCKQSYKLPEVRCEDWLGWLYITMNPDAAPLAE